MSLFILRISWCSLAWCALVHRMKSLSLPIFEEARNCREIVIVAKGVIGPKMSLYSFCLVTLHLISMVGFCSKTKSSSRA